MDVTARVMKVSRNGQVSIPAAVRSRWDVVRVQIVDHGDRLVVLPLAEDPVRALRGKYADTDLPTVDEMRRQDRDEHAEIAQRRSSPST